MATLANSEDPDEMQHNAAFHQGLHCLLKIKTTFRDRITAYFRKFYLSCDPLKYTMGSTILIVSICIGKSFRIQKVK